MVIEDDSSRPLLITAEDKEEKRKGSERQD